MRKKSAVVKFVPKDFVVIVFLGIPIPPVRQPRPLIPTVRRSCKQPSDRPAAAAADYQTLVKRIDGSHEVKCCSVQRIQKKMVEVRVN
jgi:hypothetical protein